MLNNTDPYKVCSAKCINLSIVTRARVPRQVATVVVGPAAGAAGADGFAYAALAAPVVLQAGKPYYVTQTCAKGMPDMFTNSDADAGAADQLLATLGRGVFSADGRPDHFPDQHSTDSQYK